ncbi:MAG: glutamine synthetase III [Planctomycetaceae bacterium]|nr:glutamine synthetase III [Planctomycetaceae bacterium]
MHNEHRRIETITDLYGCDVFNTSARRRYLANNVFEALEDTIQNGVPLEPTLADQVAQGMKTWALEKGASHFTHWFQPLTGATAEKHDSFIMPDHGGSCVSQFSGKELVQGEPDASSFPSGGLRATFEARGYTAWDPTSPAFVTNAYTDRAVLCIPCAFWSYHGEALDGKTPLLRSQKALHAQIERVGKLFEVERVQNPVITLGVEQEYFLIERRFFKERPDLVMTGRTLFGIRPARHQQMEDHYFSRIKPRVLAFMAEVDRRLWRLGVPAKTRHNEVSPAQFELAPIFEEQNLAVDHNLLIMSILQETAGEYGFSCLVHEKPFAGVNGSGKHNNWSITGTDGKNWFSPGQTPHDNAKFLFMLTAVIKAVDTHAALLRSAVATAGNDHRLGASEAPPAIMSIFLGEQLDEIISAIDTGCSIRGRANGGCDMIEIGVDALPKIPRDVSDRNRTSPVAFTGNKFEFRSVGSSQSCENTNTILNMIMAEALDKMCTEMESRLEGTESHKDADGHSREFHDALKAVLRREIQDHKRVLFSGDGYSDDWTAEAARRGLPNIKTTPEALKAMIQPETVALFGELSVLSEREAMSRYEVYRHAWEQTLAMEGGCALDLARTFVMPAALRFEKKLAESLTRSQALGRDAKTRLKAYNQVADLVDRLYNAMDAMDLALQSETAEILPALTVLRTIVDKLESLSPEAFWPFPNYGQMFFNYGAAPQA